MSITTKVVSSNPVHGEVYSIKYYVIRFVSDLQQVGRRFSLGTPVSSTNKTDRHEVTEILLKVALNTINQTNPIHSSLIPHFCIYFVRTYLYIVDLVNVVAVLNMPNICFAEC